MRLFNLLSFYLFVLAHAVVWNAPLLAGVWLFRHRVRGTLARIMVALGFSAVTAWLFWKMEWFDVWRHGIPSLSYLFGLYLPWIVAVGVAGWFLGGWVVRERHGSSVQLR